MAELGVSSAGGAHSAKSAREGARGLSQQIFHGKVKDYQAGTSSPSVIFLFDPCLCGITSLDEILRKCVRAWMPGVPV